MLTKWVTIAAALNILAFPVVIRLFKVSAHTRAVKLGSESSVKQRDSVRAIIWFGTYSFHRGHCHRRTTAHCSLFSHAEQGSRLSREAAATIAGGSSVLGLSAAGKILSYLDQGQTGKTEAGTWQRWPSGSWVFSSPLSLSSTSQNISCTAMLLHSIGCCWQIAPIILGLGVVLVMLVGIVKQDAAQLWLVGALCSAE